MDREMVSCSWMESRRAPRGGDSYKKLQMKVRICLLEQLLVWRLGSWIKCPFFFFFLHLNFNGLSGSPPCWSLHYILIPTPILTRNVSVQRCPGWNFKVCRLSPQYGELLTLTHITTTERAQSHPHLTLLFSPSCHQTRVSPPVFLRIPTCIPNTHSFISMSECHLSQPLNAFLGGWSEPASGQTDETKELVGLGNTLEVCVNGVCSVSRVERK